MIFSITRQNHFLRIAHHRMGKNNSCRRDDMPGWYIYMWPRRACEKELPEEEKKKSVAEFNLTKGLIVAIISGILSACFNFGIEAGKPMAKAAVAAGSIRYSKTM
jgi:hypothetical protein